MYLVFPVFYAKPISIQAFYNTSAFLSIALISSPLNGMDTSLEWKIVIVHRRFTSGYRTVGGEEGDM